MTGYKTRHFYNNLLSINNIRYLEIGYWKGSSTCAAVYQNIGENTLNFIKSDCFKLDRSILGKFDIYLYDGDHSAFAHYRALSYFINNMKDTFIFIIDDWNFNDVRLGTQNVISDLGLRIVYEKEIKTTEDGSRAPLIKAIPGWWNGIYVAVLSKN